MEESNPSSPLVLLAGGRDLSLQLQPTPAFRLFARLFCPLLNIFFALDLHLPNLIGKKKLLMVQCNNPTRRLGNSTRTRSYGSPEGSFEARLF